MRFCVCVCVYFKKFLNVFNVDYKSEAFDFFWFLAKQAITHEMVLRGLSSHGQVKTCTSLLSWPQHKESTKECLHSQFGERHQN